MAETTDGDEAELVPRPSWWRDVAASHEDCIGTSCAHYPEPDLEELEATDPDAADRVLERWASEHPHPGPPCFAVLARRAALGARFIVTNHHLLLFLERCAISRDCLLQTRRPAFTRTQGFERRT